eukprot:10329245-Alexandrium_andersonii.AAC.1
MSASLVGSEMCIRDRERSSRARLESAEPASKRNATVCAASSRTVVTVSYTHLTLPTICSV